MVSTSVYTRTYRSICRYIFILIFFFRGKSHVLSSGCRGQKLQQSQDIFLRTSILIQSLYQHVEQCIIWYMYLSFFLSFSYSAYTISWAMCLFRKRRLWLGDKKRIQKFYRTMFFLALRTRNTTICEHTCSDLLFFFSLENLIRWRLSFCIHTYCNRDLVRLVEPFVSDLWGWKYIT